MKLNCAPFNLDVTLCCGQVFRWHKKQGWWFGIAQNKIIKVRQADPNSELEYENAGEIFLENYFGLEDDLQAISSEIGKDPHIRKALQQFCGLRIIRQDPWECLISYICATYKNIPAINHMLNNLSRKFGKKITLDQTEFYTFPTPEQLVNATNQDLTMCGLGYRAKYVKETSKRIFERTFELNNLRQLPYEQAKTALCTLPGVGSKVADCILLFSMGKLEAFPVDRWVERVILNHYAQQIPTELAQKLAKNAGLNVSQYKKLNNFGRKYFGQYAGYAQEYLYHYERLINQKTKPKH